MKNIIILTGLLSCSFIAAGNDAQNAGTPVGEWRFDEADGKQVKDSSGNGSNGIISRDMLNVKRVSGRNGTALNFNQNNKKYGSAVLPDFARKHAFFAKGITIEAWIKLNSTFKREQSYEIVSNTESDRGKGFRFFISWERLVFKSGEGGKGKTWGVESKPSLNLLKPDIWYHVAATYDASVFSVYIDGELVGQSEPALALTPGRKDVFIGSYGDGYAYGFDGSIECLVIYDYARTAVQILNDAKK